MSYQVLARKYRPQTFESILGQEHVTQILVNAISTNRVAHAILFTGPRGTGKTTIARILAKAMNCKKGPDPFPCNQCKNCLEIIHGHSADVFEIDGASNNSVDQIRNLRENAAYMPASSLYKIYIIDEVHMLSIAAFNALLKTLEEPPAHVMFIFATTEAHKIPATILSRCQRHDLARISLDVIADHLKHLCELEGYSIDQKTADFIAMEADGSIRDSLSLLERIISSNVNNHIFFEKVLETLGIPDRRIMLELGEAVFSRNGSALLHLIEKIDDSGLDLKKFYADIVFYFRNLNVLKLCGAETPSVNLTNTEKKELLNIVSSVSAEYLSIILQTLLNEEAIIKLSSYTRTAMEMILLKLIRIEPDTASYTDIDQIIESLAHLVKEISCLDSNGEIPNKSVTAPETPPCSLCEPSIPIIENEEMIQESNSPNTEINQKNISQPIKIIESEPATLQEAEPHKAQQPDISTESKPTTWSGFLSWLHKKFPFIAALIEEAKVTETDDRILVEFKNSSSFNTSRIKMKKAELIEQCRKFLNKELCIEIVSEATIIDASTISNNRTEAFKAKQAALDHPLVREAKKIFNGEII